MNLGILIPIVAILASAWVLVTMMKMRAEGGGKRRGENERRLARENEELRALARKLDERVAVLERIATDPARRTAREIDELR